MIHLPTRYLLRLLFRPHPPCIPDLSGNEEEVLLDDEEKVGSFVNLRVTRVKGEKCSSLVKVDQNELRAHCFTFGTLEELVNHSPPIGDDLHGQRETLEQQTYGMTPSNEKENVVCNKC